MRRIVENHVGSGNGRDTPRTITAVTPVRSEEIEGDDASVRENETIGRAMVCQVGAFTLSRPAGRPAG